MKEKQEELVAEFLVSFWGVKCYMNDTTGDLWGVNWINDKMIGVAAWFHNVMSAITMFFNPSWQQPGFMFKVIEDYRNKEIS